MNAREVITLYLVLATTAVSAAQAAPIIGTNKARGIYTGNGWESQSEAGSQSSYRYSATAPNYRSSEPAVQAAATPTVAQAPTEGRRFSHAPDPAAASSDLSPQGQATATAPAENGARRFSYAPALDATVAPAPTPAPRVYSTRPSYWSRSGSRSNVGQFPLLKTDPRKYFNN